MQSIPQRPSNAFIGAAWAALLVGTIAFFIGLYNATIPIHEKGYYGTVLLFGLFSAVSLQKTVRDQAESLPVTAVYVGLCWTSVIVAITLMTVGLWNATLTLSEKGFYGMAFTLSIFAAITVQKNTRDCAASERAATIHVPSYEYALGELNS